MACRHEAAVGYAKHRDFLKAAHFPELRERIHNVIIVIIHSFAEYPGDVAVYTLLSPGS